jgi:S1-C subfamily serine protease
MNVEIDIYSTSCLPIRMAFGDTELGLGTGFIWQSATESYLITNWHNVTGKNPFTGKHLSETAAEPDRLRVYWMKKSAPQQRVVHEHVLRDDAGAPTWLVHPSLRQKVDVVALPLQVPADAHPFPINQLPADAITVPIATDVYVLGYPFGIGPAGLPIWKRGSIASEPQVLDPTRPCVFIDTASRPGMSGSPVIARASGAVAMEDGSVVMNQASATRFVGVYSGRLHAADALDAQLGMMWPANFVREIVNGRTRDT